MTHNSLKGFKKIIDSQPREELETCFDLLETLQMYRCFSAARRACPDLPTEPPESGWRRSFVMRVFEQNYAQP